MSLLQRSGGQSVFVLASVALRFGPENMGGGGLSLCKDWGGSAILLWFCARKCLQSYIVKDVKSRNFFYELFGEMALLSYFCGVLLNWYTKMLHKRIFSKD